MKELPPSSLLPEDDEDFDHALFLCDQMLEFLDELSTAIGLVEAPEEMLKEIIDNSTDTKN